MNAEPNHGAPEASESNDTRAEAAPSTLRGRIRPLPAETDDETFLPFLDLCFNWSMDKPRIDIDELAHRSDAVFYFRDWGRNGDIAVAAHAEADAASPIIGLAWVRLADIDDVVSRTEARVGGDFAAALGKSTTEVVRSEVVPDNAEKTQDAEKDQEAQESAETDADLTSRDDATPFTGYGWVAADIPELTVAVLPEHQGQGIGGVLVDTVCALARMSGFPAVSLSVEDGNAAVKLYTDHGFVTVGRNGDSDVLVRRLSTD
jgi:ribosomal protein S18 acetylase RimI-like enzyme